MTTRVVNWKRRPCDVYIGRPSIWGNPYSIGRHGTREEVIALYKRYLAKRPDLIQRAREELRGKTLGCWCSPKACHGDVLARVAEGGDP